MSPYHGTRCAGPHRCSRLPSTLRLRPHHRTAVQASESPGRPDTPRGDPVPPPPLPPPPPPPPPPPSPPKVVSSSQKWRITPRDLIAASIGAVIGGSVMYTIDAIFAEYLFDVDGLNGDVYEDEYGPIDVPPNLEPYMSRFRQAPAPMLTDPNMSMQPAYPPGPGEYMPRGREYPGPIPSAGMYPGMGGAAVPRYQDVPDVDGQWSKPVMSQQGVQDGNQPTAP